MKKPAVMATSLLMAATATTSSPANAVEVTLTGICHFHLTSEEARIIGSDYNKQAITPVLSTNYLENIADKESLAAVEEARQHAQRVRKEHGITTPFLELDRKYGAKYPFYNDAKIAANPELSVYSSERKVKESKINIEAFRKCQALGGAHNLKTTNIQGAPPGQIAATVISVLGALTAVVASTAGLLPYLPDLPDLSGLSDLSALSKLPGF